MLSYQPEKNEYPLRIFMVTCHIQNMKLRHKPNMPLQPGNLSNTSLDQETSVNSGVRHQPVHFKEIHYYQ